MFSKYKGAEFIEPINKLKLPINHLVPGNEDDVNEFNKIYQWALNNLRQVEPTNSGGVPLGRYRDYERFILYITKASVELVICSLEYGCYRFLFATTRNEEDNPVSGMTAVREIYKVCDELHVDLSKYKAVWGKQSKDEIVKPHIELLEPSMIGRYVPHVYHLDLNSAYASEIEKEIPELHKVYNYMYIRRKEKDGYYKHVLTNSIGCFQSTCCPDWEERRRTHPYMFANLAKIAINNTRAKIEKYIKKLEDDDCVPILTNTDGIWYYSDHGAFHDGCEGTNLGQWKTDHSDVVLLIKSKGAYQFLEDGKCHTKVRGLTNLDKIKAREDWEFGEIMKNEIVREKFYFKEGEGFKTYGEEL